MLNIIAAIGKQRELGKDNKLLWHLPNDLKHFKKLTDDSIIIMGRKTFDSIINRNGKPLPNRTHIVLTHDKNFKSEHPEVFAYHSVKDILHEYYNYGQGLGNVFIIGGGEIYRQFMDHADTLYITEVDGTFEADAHFPTIHKDKWESISEEHHLADDKNEYNHTFKVYKKKK